MTTQWMQNTLTNHSYRELYPLLDLVSIFSVHFFRALSYLPCCRQYVAAVVVVLLWAQEPAMGPSPPQTTTDLSDVPGCMSVARPRARASCFGPGHTCQKC